MPKFTATCTTHGRIAVSESAGYVETQAAVHRSVHPDCSASVRSWVCLTMEAYDALPPEDRTIDGRKAYVHDHDGTPLLMPVKFE